MVCFCRRNETEIPFRYFAQLDLEPLTVSESSAHSLGKQASQADFRRAKDALVFVGWIDL